MTMLFLALLIATNNPATNGSAAIISLNVACILVTLNFHSEVRLLNLLEKHINATEHVFRIVEAQGKILEVQGSQPEAMASRLAESQRLVKDGSP